MANLARGNVRRTLKDIKAWHTSQEIFRLITAKSWPYKTDLEFYRARDKALMAIDFVGGFRNNEPLLYKTVFENGETKREINSQALRRSNFENTNSWLILKEAKISKRSAKLIAKYGSRITTRETILFPKYQHPLQPFTDLILDYILSFLDIADEPLFKFGERRHHQIVYYVTGEWPHWLRSMGENWYGHNVWRNDPVSLAKFVGVVNVQSVMAYVGFDEESYRERLKSATDRK